MRELGDEGEAPAWRSVPVRGRVGRRRILDLLLGRRRRRSRPGAHPGDLPGGRADVRPHVALLRGGRGDAAGAGRIRHLRPARLQRADQLHRRLGDPDRLPDRDRGGVDHGLPLPDADLGHVRRRGRRAGRGGRRHRPRRHPQHRRRHRAKPAVSPRGAGAGRARAPAARNRRRADRRAPSGSPHGRAPSLLLSERQGHRLLARDRNDRLRGHRGGERPGSGPRIRAGGPEAGAGGGRDCDPADLRGNRRRGPDGGPGRVGSARPGDRARRQVHRGADSGGGGQLPPRLARRRHEMGGDAGRGARSLLGGEHVDAGPLETRLRAGDQPPDPELGRQAREELLDALHRDHHRRRCWRSRWRYPATSAFWRGSTRSVRCSR